MRIHKEKEKKNGYWCEVGDWTGDTACPPFPGCSMVLHLLYGLRVREDQKERGVSRKSVIKFFSALSLFQLGPGARTWHCVRV